MQKGAYTIRKSRRQDLPAVMEVLKTANYHHIPSNEMPEINLRFFFVAEHDNRIVGVGGYKILGPQEGKTTLMAVLPSMRGWGIGGALQRARLGAMKAAGVQRVITNADLPETIRWYQKHFSYRVIGTIPKEHEFGNPDIDHWTTLEMDLGRWEEDS